MTLSQAIDDLLAFVEARKTIPRSEMERFRELDEAVFMAAVGRNWHSTLPTQSELERPMYSPGLDLSPVMFEGRTRLPGD
jgi:hypothetical protein